VSFKTQAGGCKQSQLKYPRGESKTWGMILEDELAPPVSWIRATLAEVLWPNSCRMSSLASTIEQSIKCTTGWAWLWCFNKCTDNCHVMRFWYCLFSWESRPRDKDSIISCLPHPHLELLSVNIVLPLVCFCNLPLSHCGHNTLCSRFKGKLHTVLLNVNDVP